MACVSIDISKLNHFDAAISSDDKILIELFQFSNDYDGFFLIWYHLTGLESTSRYGDNLVCFLLSKDFNACFLNLILTSSMRKNNVRTTKTDKVDTFVIAKTLMIQDSLRFMTLEELDCI